MQRLRTSGSNLYQYLLANKTTFLASSSALPKRSSINLGIISSTCPVFSKGNRFPLLIRNMSGSTSVGEQVIHEAAGQQVSLSSKNDFHGGVTVNVEEPMSSEDFTPLLRASISQWRQQGKKGVWLKLPIEHSNLVDAAVKEGFRYHHAEPDYLMLVKWIPETTDTLPANASHRVGIGAFVMNNKREVLVVHESSGRFKGTGIWKFPTGVVNEGEDISTAAIREVKEETGIETEFEELLAFRQSHNAFFSKSDLFFVCMLRPRSFDIQKQELEIEAAQWMPVEEYADQRFVRENELFRSIAKICLEKLDKDYTGFRPLSTTTSSGKTSSLYFNNRDLKHETPTSF